MYQINKRAVKKLLVEKDLKVTQLCKLLNITTITFYTIVNNTHRTYLDTALKLCDILECSIYDIISNNNK